jgi:uncharacterized protein YyaL (SSP411 family)
MSVFLTPDRRPFLARTYLPPSTLRTVAGQVKRLWRQDRARLESVADEIADVVRRMARGFEGETVAGSDADLLAGALARLAQEFDRERGGFDRAPKFPPHAALLLLLDRGGAALGPDGLAMAKTTLDAMARGGIHDQVGGGFHRYSTDARWLVPHFEKMLYDNALLALAYVEAQAVFQEPAYGRVARGIFGWIEREMSVVGGGYASSLDADTSGHEGLTYTWTVEELRAALGAEDAALAARVFGVEERGNYDEEASGRATGRNILHLPVPLAELASREGRPLDAWRQDVSRIRTRLLAARAKRAQPGRDGKVIAGWNGLLLSAYARAGAVWKDASYLERGAALARFLLTACRENGRLLRLPAASGPRIPAFLDDHVHVADGLLDLADATGDARLADEAQTLADEVLRRFADPAGGFYSSADDHEALLARPKDAFDSPIPSANATAARVLLRLSVRTGKTAYREACDRAVAAFRPLLARAPTGTLALARVIADRAALGPVAAAPSAGDVEVRRGPAAVSLFLERGEARPGTKVRFALRVALEPGVHVNPGSGVEAPLVATALALAPKAPATLADVAFPAPTRKSPGPGAAPIALLDGTFEVTGALAIPADAPPGPRRIGILLTFQPCDATACRAPEEVRLDAVIRYSDADGPVRHPSRFR